MAEWILVLVPTGADLETVANAISQHGLSQVSLWAADSIVDVTGGKERVQLAREDEVLAEYQPDELAAIREAIPEPGLYRVSYHRGTSLLEQVLQALAGIDVPILVDNDFGVIERLEDVLTEGISGFLARRGRRFAEH